MFSSFNWLYVRAYLVVTFALGFVRHLLIFKKLYARFGNFDNLEKPRFEFGLLSMFCQGVALAIIYPKVSQWEFFISMFIIRTSFIAFAELGKHIVHKIPLFLLVQILYCLLHTILIAVVFDQLPCRLGVPNCD